MAKFLVTGINGQLGYEIVRELKERGFKGDDIIATDYQDMDITNIDSVRKVFTQNKPTVVFLCAAYTNADKAETEPEKCYDVNVNGTVNICQLCKEYNCKLIFISSDYVFDGTKKGIYEIDDVTNPLNYYGKTKCLGELETSKLEKWFVVRISWAFGINGKNFIKTILEKAQATKEVFVVDDQIGSPTYMYDLSKVLVDMSLSDRYGIYHVTNEGYCSWYELAKFAIEYNKVSAKVVPVKTVDYKVIAKRPLNSRLSKKSLLDNGFKLLPTWQDAVIRYSKELKKESSR